jgi:hypothetical protein
LRYTKFLTSSFSAPNSLVKNLTRLVAGGFKSTLKYPGLAAAAPTAAQKFLAKDIGQG